MKNRKIVQNSSEFKIVHENNMFILLIDLNVGKSITNDACNVVPRLAQKIQINGRRVFYRDTSGRFDELRVCHDKYFMGFAPCSPGQQDFFKKIIQRKETQETKK